MKARPVVTQPTWIDDVRGCLSVTLFVLLVLAGVSAAKAEAAAEPEPIEILFIGNSYTAGWGDEARGRLAAKAGGVPGLLQKLAEARGKAVLTDRSIRGGTALHEHLDDGTRVIDALEKRPWDIVVLQEYSTLPTRKGDGTHGTTEDFLAAVKEFDEVIRERHPDAKIVLFETWARAAGDKMYPRYIPDVAAMNDDLQTNYANAAASIGARVVPVGSAWELALERRPDIPLHVEDLSHPRAAGVYLAALVFYAKLFEEDPRGLPALVEVAPEDAAFLQEVAWEVVAPRLQGAQPASAPAAGR